MLGQVEGEVKVEWGRMLDVRSLRLEVETSSTLAGTFVMLAVSY
jgi:hypothetical protein